MDTSLVLTIIGVILTVAAVVIAIVIAFKQNTMLAGIHTIADDTSTTARKLDADAVTKRVVDKFFGADKKYNCSVPVRYHGKPLPAIEAGDYHALHILQSLLDKRLELCLTDYLDGGTTAGEVSSDEPPLDGKVPASAKTRSEVQYDTIYLCSPSVNAELQRLAPPLQVAADDTLISNGPTCGKRELPCWFAVQGGKKVIWVDTGAAVGQVITSGAETEYTKAAAAAVGHVIASSTETECDKSVAEAAGTSYKPSDAPKRDSGILMRLTVQKRMVIVIAGIHQFGTWIVGEFFHRLTLGTSRVHEDPLADYLKQLDEDFIGIISGEFKPDELKVDSCEMAPSQFWVYKDEKWARTLIEEKR